MKKVFLLVAVLFLLSACAPPQALQDDTKSEDIQKEIFGIDPFIKALIEKGRDEMPNIRYRFSMLPNLNTELVNIYDESAKIEISKVGTNVKDYSVVYVDMKSGTAMGVCEERKNIECRVMGKKFVLDYNNFKMVTPHSWLREVALDAKKTGTENIGGSQVTVIEFDNKNEMFKMWIDDFYEIPVKVQHTKDSESVTYQYDIISVGDVKESEVTIE